MDEHQEENSKKYLIERWPNMDIAFAIGIGLIAGIAGGLFGIGGGSIIVPLIVMIYGFGQHMAQGISVAAMLPPIGLLAAYKYHQSGNVNWKISLIIAGGFMFGGYIGAYIANLLSPKWMSRIFGFYFLILSLKMIFKK
jgi:uncharacterized membrane protein YfcA